MSKNTHKRTTKRTASGKNHRPSATFKYSHPLIVVALGFLTLLALTNIKTTQSFTAGAQNVLGDNEDKSEEKKDENKGSENKQEDNKQEDQNKSTEQQKESENKQVEQQNESIKKSEEQRKETTRTSVSSDRLTRTKSETVTSAGLKMKSESEGTKQESEIETADGLKIKTKTEDDGTTKVEIENGTVKLKYRIENGKVVLKAEDENGDEVEMEDSELTELEDSVDDETGGDDLKLASTTDDRLSVTRNQIKAITDFPLSIDVETRELVVTTPDGEKIVTVLPDQAVENLLATGIISKLETPPTGTDAETQPDALTGEIKIETRNNEIVYRVNGVKTHRLLGFIPVNTQTTAFVSADSGNVVAQERSLLTSFVDLLSP